MKEFVYPAGLILIPLAYNTYNTSPKFGLMQTKLDALNVKLDALSKKVDVLVGCHAVTELRLESSEKAHLGLEQKMAECKNMAQEM